MPRRRASNCLQEVSILTLGCAKNIYDTQRATAVLLAHGVSVRLVQEVEPAQTLIINTCGFIAPAVEENLGVIEEACALARKGLIGRLIVAGCLVERWKDKLQGQYPEVSEWWGVPLDRQISVNWKIKPNGTAIPTASHYTYVKISEGCNRRCSFCVIPLIRGKMHSRPIEEIAHEAQEHLNRGVKEIILVSQDTSLYGADLYRKAALPRLIERLCSLSSPAGRWWLRLHYLHPSGFPFEILDMMDCSPLCRYIDMPIQHCSDRILKLMKRGHTRRQLEHLLETIRTRVPQVTLRTTLIVGFPGEGDREFEELCRFVEHWRFERLGVFTYNHERGSSAWKSLSDTVPPEEKEERAETLMQIQHAIMWEKHQQFIGKTMEVLVDEARQDEAIARTEADSPEVDCQVRIVNHKHKLKAGTFAKVRIMAADAYELTGVPSP